MTVRSDLAAALKDELPNVYRIIPYAKNLDRIDKGRPIVMLYRESVEPSATLPAHHLTNTITVWILHPEVKPGDVDDALDNSLDIVIAALDATRLTTWSRAERGLWGDDEYNGFKITCETHSEKEI